MHAAGSTEIDGYWEMVRAEFDGEAAPEFVVRQTTLEFEQGRYCIRFAGAASDRGRFAISENSEVKTLLLRGVEGPNAQREIACIFQLSGNRLRICFGLAGVPPTEFVTATGNARYLATYRRASAPSFHCSGVSQLAPPFSPSDMT